MKLSKNAIEVLERRYLSKGKNGEILETPKEMFERVAFEVAKADENVFSPEEVIALEKDFYKMMSNMDFLPNSPTLMNAGKSIGQLSACFVLPIEDTMESIFETVKNAALIHKSGGGTGFSFSKLRPKGSYVNSSGGVASGPVSFMKVFNAATEAVKQGGTRRGANMAVLDVNHPDILDFISCKEDNEELVNFNISVAISEAFMEAVEKGEDYDLIDPFTKKVTSTLNAEKVFNRIINNAWLNGEPGILFLDRINKENTVPGSGVFECTNPCGEQPLLPYEACNLGSINLYQMINEEKTDFDYEKIKNTVTKAVHFLDNVISINKYPNKLINQKTKNTRKIGLGVMGWADSLFALNVPYNSQEALELGRNVMHFINNTSKKASIGLANIKGVFPDYDKSIYKNQELLIRNATTTTIAPTGTISLLAGVSSGIEPAFALSYIRNIMDGTELVEANSVLEEKLKERGIYSIDLMRKIAQEGSIQNIDEIDEDIKQVFMSSHDISPEWHVKMQAVFQENTDNSVSKTINLKKEATIEDVKYAFLLAYALGCKGVTIYRDGSRENQVLNIKGQGTIKRKRPKPRQEITKGITQKVKIGCGNLYITVNTDDEGNICDVFTNTGREGGCHSQSEATSRLISIALRSGVSVEDVVNQLIGIRCPSTEKQTTSKVLSCPDAIGRLIQKVEKERKQRLEIDNPSTNASTKTQNNCPECGKEIEHEGGCVVCRYCGFAKCH